MEKFVKRIMIINLCGLFILCGFIFEVMAYDNIYSHRDINRYSFSKFTKGAINGALRVNRHKYDKYNFNRNSYKLEGLWVTKPGLTAVEIGLHNFSYQQWIEEGGYTADEPELYSSLRHFYDPLEIQINPDLSKHVPYLTDHVGDILDRLVSAAKVDPRMDAREWALTGPARRGYPRNQFSLRRGVEYMRKAWAEKNQKLKDRLFAAAWRSCGETMHLLSDMTVPAHVRNDAHPGYPVTTIYSGIRYDPYEYYVTKNHSQIKDWSRGRVDQAISSKIEASKDLSSLFHVVALYTNQHFFSCDTLAGRNSNGQQVKSANGMLPYPAPNLDRCDLDPEGFYVDRETGYHVAHVDWADTTWWNTQNYLKQTFLPSISNNFNATYSYEDVIIDQAKVLVPLAATANCKLLDMFIPEVKVKLTSWDNEKRILTGSISHIISGVYADRDLYPSSKPLLFNSAEGQRKSWSHLEVNNHSYSAVAGDYALSIVNNKIQITLGKNIQLTNGENYSDLDLYLGGYYVASNRLKFVSNKAMRPPIASPPDTKFNDHLSITVTSPDGGYIVYRVNGGALQTYSAPIDLKETSVIEAYADKDPHNKSPMASEVATFQYTKEKVDKKAGRWVLAKVIPINGCSFFKHDCYTVNCSGGSGSWKIQKSESSCSNSVKVKSGSGAYSVPPKSLVPGEVVRLSTSVSGAKGFATTLGVDFYNEAKGIIFNNKGRANHHPAWCEDVARSYTSRSGSIPPEGDFRVPKELNEKGLLVIQATGTAGSFDTSMINLYLYKWQK